MCTTDGSARLVEHATHLQQRFQSLRLSFESCVVQCFKSMLVLGFQVSPRPHKRSDAYDIIANR